MPDPDRPLPEIPLSNTSAKKARISLVWVVPIVAALVGAWVAVTRILGAGPEITITFKTADGLEAGKTKIDFNGVELGTIQSIRLSEDHLHVVTTAQMSPTAEGFLVEGTRFWVVRPRLSGASISGLGTLISGAYIGMEIGQSQEPKRDFVALETPPAIGSDVPGRYFVLKTPDMGSIDIGTPVHFRKLQVGEVTSYALDKDGRSLSVQVFVRAPHDAYVSASTRFWHASGIDVSLSASGMNVETQSLLSILIGGIAFEMPADAPPLPEAKADTEFTLFANRSAAFAPPDRDPQEFVLVFKQSVRGLAVGAPVEFKGIPIGVVTEIHAQLDRQAAEFSVPVTIRVDVYKFGVRILPQDPDVDSAATRRKAIEMLVSRGLRARLETASLLTGSLLVGLEIVPDAPAVSLDWSQVPLQFPTVPGQFEALGASLASIVKKLDALPFEAIGADVKKAIEALDQLLLSARGTVDDARGLVKPVSALSEEGAASLQELTRAARALRVLADYLERHPEALLRGKADKDE